MKGKISILFISIAAACILSSSLFAQETTEITIQIKKDGKVVQDKTYQVEDDDKDVIAMKSEDREIIEIIGDEENHGNIEIKEILGDHDGENVKVIVVKTSHKDCHHKCDKKCCEKDEKACCEKDEKACCEKGEKEVEIEVEKKVKKKSKNQ